MFIRKNHFIVLLGVTLLFSACKKVEKEESTVDDSVKTTVITSRKIKVTLDSKNETNATGKAVFKEEDGSITITAIISGLSSGEHPVYILNQQFDTDKIFVGNLIADENGNGTISKILEARCIGCGDSSKDIAGKTIAIFTGADNQKISCSGLIN